MFLVPNPSLFILVNNVRNVCLRLSVIYTTDDDDGDDSSFRERKVRPM